MLEDRLLIEMNLRVQGREFTSKVTITKNALDADNVRTTAERMYEAIMDYAKLNKRKELTEEEDL